VEASPHVAEICDLFTVLSCFFSGTRLGRTVEPIFTLYGSNDEGAFWRLGRWVTSFGRDVPSKPPEMGVNRPFQAKTAKYKNRNFSENINTIKTKFEDQPQTTALRG